MASLVTRTREFTLEVTDEIKKVTWPDWPQLKDTTFRIIIFVLIVALIIWLMDISVRGILNVVMNFFTGG